MTQAGPDGGGATGTGAPATGPLDAPPGPGWWQASDGKWYSPEQRPGTGHTAPAGPGAPAWGSGPMPYPGPAPYGAGYPYPGPMPYGTPPIKKTPVGVVIAIVAGVVLLIAVLLAIAIPTFIGATHSIFDRVAQTALQNAVPPATDYHDAHGTFSGISTQDLEANSANTFYEAPLTSTAPGQVSYSVDTPDQMTFAVAAPGDGCWFIRVQEVPVASPSGSTAQGSGTPTLLFGHTVNSACSAGNPPGSWKSSGF